MVVRREPDDDTDIGEKRNKNVIEDQAKTGENDRLRLMKLKVSAAKEGVTRALSNIELTMEKFEEYKKAGGSAKRINATAKEINS